MIDGESSKAELLQSSKCSSGDMTAVILMFTWSKSVKIWQKKTREAAAEAERLYNYTKSVTNSASVAPSNRHQREPSPEY